MDLSGRGRSRLRADRTKPDANDRPVGPAPCHLPEASVIVHGLRSKPHVFVLGTSGFVHWVSFHQSRPSLSGVRHCALEERACHALAPVLGRHNKADHRPDGLLIHRFHNRRALEPGVVLTWTDGDPADWDFAAIGDQPRWRSSIDQRSEGGTIRLGARHSLRSRWFMRAAEAVGHAPTATRERATSGIEHRFEVGPTSRGERSNCELHRHCGVRIMECTRCRGSVKVGMGKGRGTIVGLLNILVAALL